MKDLFVCYVGMIRSKIAAGIARRLAEEKGIKDYTAENTGIGELLFLPQLRLSYKIGGYSRIFVMENKFRKWIAQRTGVQEDGIINLDVTGELVRPRESVRAELEEKLKPYFAS